MATFLIYNYHHHHGCIEITDPTYPGSRLP